MVEISNISFADEYTGNTNPFLANNIFDKLTCTINCSVHWESLQIAVSCVSGTKTITRSDNVSWIKTGFRKGDTFTIVGGTNPGNFTIASLTDYVITTVEAVTTASDPAVDFHGTTPIEGIDFYFNLIENSQTPTFSSLTDSITLQKKTAGESPWVINDVLDLFVTTPSSGWDTGSGTVKKTATVAYKQNFIIIHTFIITPVFLTGQESLMVAPYLIKPEYFELGKCLKYVCKIDAKYDFLNPNIAHTNNTAFQLGNTGWFNEFTNGSPARFTQDSIVYEGITSLAVLDRVSLNEDTKVTIIIKSNIAVFNASSRVILNQIYCPLDSSDYIGTETNFKNNFKHDRKMVLIDQAAVNGEEYGTVLQTIKNFQFITIDTTHAKVVYTVAYSNEIKDFLKSKEVTNRNYLISVVPQSNVPYYGFAESQPG